MSKPTTLARLRHKAGMTPQQVEERTRGAVSIGNLVLIESEERPQLSRETMQALARAYRVPYAAVLRAAGYLTAADVRRFRNAA